MSGIKERFDGLAKRLSWANKPGITVTELDAKARVKKDLASALKKDPAGVMAAIIKNQRSLYKKDIKHWLGARDSALNNQNPDRSLLYDLYDDIILDGFIYGQVNNRILRITNNNIKIVSKSSLKIDKEKTDLLKKKWFRRTVRHAMESRFYGYSLIYFMEVDPQIKTVQLVPRRHVVPEKSIIKINETDQDGIDYTQPPYTQYCLPVGDAEDFGLLDKAAPLFILKKHSWQNWDEFEEMFGVPIRIAKTASQDQKVKAEIQKWLQDMGSAAYGIFPEGTTLDIKESQQTDSFKVFNEKRKAANEELAVLLNGQTMTTMNGSSRSQGEVHQDTEGEITKDDKIFITDMVNEDLMPMLTLNGYPYTDDDEFSFDDTKQISIKEKAEVYKAVTEMGFELDKDDVETQFGVKIVGKKTTGNPSASGEKAKMYYKISKLHYDINKLYKAHTHV